MAALDFPVSPTNGQVYTSGARSWFYNSTLGAWEGGAAALDLSGYATTAANLSDLANAATARTNLGVDAAGTDNSTDVTLAGTGTYASIA
jgi:hypothetical protein